MSKENQKIHLHLTPRSARQLRDVCDSYYAEWPDTDSSGTARMTSLVLWDAMQELDPNADWENLALGAGA